MLLERIDKLEQRIAALESKQSVIAQPAQAQPATPQPTTPATSGSQPAVAATPVAIAGSNDGAFAFADGTTLNFDLDGYFGYNFNHPTGQVNLLRANDPLSDSFP